jgi:pimeloyl-ACP methyl ester carboxylesterase
MKIPLLLLAGLLSNERLWLHQRENLSDLASVQIISASDDTPEKMIHTILSQAPEKFALAGHSMGGWLAQEVMRVAPERVLKLCLLNTTSRMDSEEKRISRLKMIEKVKEGSFKEVVKGIADKFVFNTQVKKDVEKMFLEVGEEAFINQELSMLKRSETKTVLSAITCPTLVIYAEKDPVFSLQEHQEMAGLIKNSKLVTIKNSGHMSPMEAPDSVTSVLRAWLL